MGSNKPFPKQDGKTSSACSSGSPTLLSMGLPEAECPADELVQLLDPSPCSALVQRDQDKLRSEEDILIDAGVIRDSSATTVGSATTAGILCMAMGALSAALMAVFVKLAGNSGLSTWEILFWRSNVVATSCLIYFIWARVKPWGNR